MVILDTNVISEMTRSAPEPNVVAWYMRQDSGSLFTTTVTLAEVLYGINLLPEGNRRSGLSEFAGDFFRDEMAGKILSFDEIAAIHYGRIRAAKRGLGLSMSSLDAQIAAIAAEAGASIATRNVDDFKYCGVTVINPWVA
jgi:predicted nucleic acid-binding protein